MQAFAELLDRLLLTPQRNAKLDVMAAYFAATPDPARGIALAALTGALDLKSVKSAALHALIAERMDGELFRLSYDFVGDLAETISLAWPVTPGANRSPDLAEVVETLSGATRAAATAQIARWLDSLDATGRWALLKLVTGGLRVGVSERLAKQALAQFGAVDVTELEEIWHGLAAPYTDLFAWLEGRAPRPISNIAARFRPVMLAHPLVAKSERDTPDAIDPALIDPAIFAAEWKYDGIRVQVSSEIGVRRMYTRTGEDISHTFPDVIAAIRFDAVIDGELLVRNEGDMQVASFNALQQRLNRKTVSKAMLTAAPAFVCAYDLMHVGETDLRGLALRDRRARLETFIADLASARFTLSPLIAFAGLEDLTAARASPPMSSIEGVMLKRWDSPYLAGRVAGHWYKWKRDPFLVDAVLLYAQRGHGKRSGFFSDFTFGVWKGDTLTPVGKAYFGFTDTELKALDAFVRANTTERFGPVSAVTPSLVVEVAFEGLQASPRHKSGVAMRFPRINRIRWDKPAAEADHIAALEAMLSV
jgi:DNA ligase 1